MNEPVKLKPCPFCGNKLNSEYTISYDYIRKCYVLYHECTFLRCHIAIYGATQEECIAAWNRRAERTGRWIPVANTWTQDEHEYGATWHKCDQCGRLCETKQLYCHCGAHMIEGDEHA